MAGTGNLILKRGVNMPYDSGQDGGGVETTPVLLQGMPAAQIIGSIWGLTSSDNAVVPGYAFDNYPNRLWIGTDKYAKDNSSYGGGAEVPEDVGTSIEPYTGSAPTHPTIHETRPIWMGAEIRAYTPLFEDTSDGSTGSSGSYVVLKADWDRPSDYVLATQKAISRMPLRYFSNATIDPPGPSSAYTPYLQFSGWNATTDGALSRSTQYLFPSSDAPTVGHVLKINSVDAGSVPGPQTVRLEWASAGSATGTMSNFTIAADTGTSQQIDDAETITFTGGTGIDTVASNTNVITFNLNLSELATESLPAVGDLLSGVDSSASNVTRNFTIGTALGVLSGDVSVNTSTGSATVSATNVKATATTDTTTFLALLETNNTNAQQVKYDTDLAYDANTNTLSVTNVSATTISGTVSTATNADNINISATTSNDTETSIVLVGGKTTGNQSPFIDSGLTYNANANILTVSGGANIGGDATIGGNLTVNGTTTTINTENLQVEDTIVTLNYGYVGTSPSDSGIEIERGDLSNVQMTWDESSKHWNAEIIDKNNVFGNGITAKIGPYPLIVGDNTDPSTETRYENSPSGAPAGTQYVHTLDVKNLVMSGTWTLGASIATDVNLSGGGLVLPHTTDVTNESNETNEGRVYWDTNLDLMTVGTGSSYKTMVDTDSTQTLSNKTLTAPKIVNNGFIADANGNEQIIFKTTSSAVNEITITNAASGSSPLIASSGGETNIDLRLQGKGTGSVVIDDNAINTTNSTFSVFNTTATTVNAFGASTALTIGATTGTATIRNSTVTLSGSTLNINGTNPVLATSQTSGNLTIFNTGFTGTANVLGAAQTINIGTSQAAGGAINIGSANTTLTSNGALTVTGALTANGNITLGSDANDTIAVNGVITTNLVFEGSTADNSETTLAASNPSADITITMPAWGGTMVVPSGSAASTYLITSSGPSSQPSWTDPDNVVVGGVFVRRETTQDTTKYPIPFLGSNKQNNPATSWSSLTSEGASQAAYLYTDMTDAGGSVSSTVTNSSSGLMYEVGNGVGTLYADYIGATLDCGTY